MESKDTEKKNDCVTCNGTGLIDAATTCDKCNGSGKESVAVKVDNTKASK